MGKPDGTGDARSSSGQKRWARAKGRDDTMARLIRHDQNEDGAGGGSTSNVGEFTKRTPQNVTRTARRIQMHHGLGPARSVHRPPQLSPNGLAVLGSGRPTYHAVQSLWDGAGNFSEPESEDEEMDVA